MKICGSLIIENNEISDAMLFLRPDFFYTLKARYLYEAICSLYAQGHPITPDTLSTHLMEKKELDTTRLEVVGGTKEILESLSGLGGGEYEFWAKEVKKKHEERQILSFADEARRLALSNPESVAVIRAKLEEQLVGFSSETHNTSMSIEAGISELDARISRYIDNPDDIIGLPTTFSKLDETLDGLQAGNVTIIYAPSSRFKSLFTTNIGWHLAEQGFPGLWFTTEMPRVQVMERLLQLEAGLNLKWLRRDKRVYEWKNEIARASKNIASYPIYFCDTSALDVNEIRSEINRHKRWNNISYVIIDLVDHVSSSRFRDEMINNQRAVMTGMKQIAKDFDIHVVLVSHVTKGDREQRKQADLDVESMVGSGAKYQDVDAAISLAPVKLDEMGRYIAMEREDILWNVSHSGKLDVMVSVTKNRHGELCRYIQELNFHRGGRFYEGFSED